MGVGCLEYNVSARLGELDLIVRTSHESHCPESSCYRSTRNISAAIVPCSNYRVACLACVEAELVLFLVLVTSWTQ